MTTGVDSFDSLVIAAIEVLGNYAERPLVAELLAVEEKTLDDPLTRLVGSGRVRNGEVLELVAPPSALPPDDLTADPSASAGPHAELSSRAAALVRAAGGSATEVADLVLAAEPKSCGRWVIETLEAAARGDSRDGKKGRASAYLLRALEERPRDNERRRLLLALASTESRTNAVGAISHYRSAIELMDAPTEKTSARIRLARCLAGNGQTLEALDELDVAAADDASDQDSLELDVAYVGLARQNIDTRPLGRSRLAEIARNHERSPLEVTSPSARAILAELAYEEVLAGDDNHSVIATAGAALGENLEGIHELPATALHVTLLSLVWAGEVRLVDRAARLIEARAKRRGASLVSVGASQILMMVHWARGDAEATVTAADHALEGASGGLVAFLPATYGTKAQALAALGRIDDARSQLELPAMGVDWSSMASYHGYLIGRARVLLVAGDPAGAEQAARRCGALAQAMGTVNPAVLPWRGIAAEASAALGHLDASRALAEEELTLARRFGAPGPVAAALAALSASATPSEAIPLLEEAVALADETPDRLAQARNREKLRVAREHRRPVKSLQPTETSAARIQSLGGFRVRDGAGTDVTPTGIASKFIRILVAADGLMHVEEVSSWLWADDIPPAQTRARLRNVLHRAHSITGPLVVRDGDLVGMMPTVSVDAAAFEAAATRVLGRDGAGVPEAIRATKLYTGDFLPGDPYAEWSVIRRERLRVLFLEVSDRAATLAAEAGQTDTALSLLETAMGHDRYDQQRYERAARLLEDAGRSSAARAMRVRANRVRDALGL